MNVLFLFLVLLYQCSAFFSQTQGWALLFNQQACHLNVTEWQSNAVQSSFPTFKFDSFFCVKIKSTEIH